MESQNPQEASTLAKHAFEGSMTLDVTVIIPVYNRRTVVLEALQCVANQTCLPRKTIIVDDGSSDGTAESVANWIDHYHGQQTDLNEMRFQLYRQPKRKAALARDFAMRNSAPTEFVCFLDSDDLWPVDFLERGVNVIGNDRGCVAASADRRFYDEAGTSFRFDCCRELASTPIEWIFRHGGGIASCSIFRRDAVLAAGGWDVPVDTAGDSMLFSLVATAGRWRHIPGDPVSFRHGNSLANNEENNLSKRHQDALQQWAVVYERIYQLLLEREAQVNMRKLRNYIAKYWYRAGKQSVVWGDPSNAKDCFDQALRWNPFLLKTRLRRHGIRKAQQPKAMSAS